jgi:hypothetical protein
MQERYQFGSPGTVEYINSDARQIRFWLGMMVCGKVSLLAS